MRRAYNSVLKLPQLSLCPQCAAPFRPHRVCPSCGYYKGRQVITVEALGSGKFTTREEGEKLFTAKVPVEFEAGKAKHVQFAWKQNSAFKQGNYKIEVYHNGFKIGEATRSLKKGGIFG